MKLICVILLFLLFIKIEKCMNVLKEISENWKLEAKQENSFRYFFYIDETKKY